MTLWKLEWLRLARTKRWVALAGAYVFFGFLGPLTARYLDDIIDAFGGIEGATIDLPPPKPIDGLAQFVSNASQLSLLVAVLVVAGSVAFDARPEMGVFLRTRAANTRDILRPRVVVSAAAVVAAFVVGAVTAWYETVVLIGALDASGVVAGILFGALYLVFVTAVVAAAAQRARTVLGTVLGSIVVLLTLPIIGIVDAVGRWLPSHLVGALVSIPDGTAAVDFLPAAAVALAASVLALALAVRWAENREL